MSRSGHNLAWNFDTARDVSFLKQLQPDAPHVVLVGPRWEAISEPGTGTCVRLALAFATRKHLSKLTLCEPRQLHLLVLAEFLKGGGTIAFLKNQCAVFDHRSHTRLSNCHAIPHSVSPFVCSACAVVAGQLKHGKRKDPMQAKEVPKHCSLSVSGKDME